MRLAVLGYAGSLHTERWAAFLAESGHDVHVVTCGGAGSVTSLPPEVIHDVGPARGSKLGYVAKIPAVRRIVRRLRPDALHVHSATSYGLLGLATGVRPLVVTAHGSDVLRTPANPLIRPVVQRVLRKADLVTVPSEQMRTAALALAAPSTPPIHVYQYGVETERLAALGRERTQSATVRVVSARPLEPLYHVDAVVRAVAELRGREVDVVLDVFGDGSERPRLERLAEGEAGVRIHGARPPREIERAFAAADVAISVAESDGVSIALLEALAAGAVPVASAIAANREWIEDGENGVLVDIDPAAIARGIERATQLDRDDVAARNRELVAARADRQTNLRRFESALAQLVDAR